MSALRIDSANPSRRARPVASYLVQHPPTHPPTSGWPLWSLVKLAGAMRLWRPRTSQRAAAARTCTRFPTARAPKPESKQGGEEASSSWRGISGRTRHQYAPQKSPVFKNKMSALQLFVGSAAAPRPLFLFVSLCFSGGARFWVLSRFFNRLVCFISPWRAAYTRTACARHNTAPSPWEAQPN
jgi:hypothetical protein